MNTTVYRMARGGFSLFLALLLAWLLWMAIHPESAFAKNGTVYKVNTDEGLNIRMDAEGDAPIIQAIGHGAKVRQLGRDGNWLLVETKSGVVGYCYGKYLTPSGYPISDPDDKPVEDYEKCYIDTIGKAKVYRSATSKSKVLGKVSDGTPVRLLAHRGKWAHIEHRDNENRGFIQLRYLRKK